MLDYNTERPKVKLPEFGRTLQKMIAYCKDVPEREERNRCAHQIARIMRNMFPELIAEDGSDAKIWDQMMIMADFDLDIDFPCEVVRAENLHPKPERIPYNNTRFRFKHYGRNIEAMIDKIASMPESMEKDELVYELANHMKLLMMMHNPEGADDARILQDLSNYSLGAINLNPYTYHLADMTGVELNSSPAAKGKKKKKKK